MKNLLLCLTLILTPGFAHAQLGTHERQGLDDTKGLLKDKKQRDDFIKTDKKAQDVDAKVDALAGSSQNKEEIYSISADVMEKLTQETNGDPDKMKVILELATKDPKAFYEKYFDAKSKERVRGVANEIEKKGSPAVPRK